MIPATLTLPRTRGDSPRPTVVLARGGPGQTRQDWRYHFLTQYLAASGYAVLLSEHRGAPGYGRAWEGKGVFQDWRQVVADIHDGTRYAVAEGIADPQRICAIGWGYGAHSALMSVIELPELYRCVVSISGVTDPVAVGVERSLRSIGGGASRDWIGSSKEVRIEGSAVVR